MEKYLTEAKATIPETERAHKESKHQLHIQLYETRVENQRLHGENVDLKSHAKDLQGEVGEMSKIIDDRSSSFKPRWFFTRHDSPRRLHITRSH